MYQLEVWDKSGVLGYTIKMHSVELRKEDIFCMYKFLNRRYSCASSIYHYYTVYYNGVIILICVLYNCSDENHSNKWCKCN